MSFDIEPGVTGLLGANGAGKSTTLRLFLGLLRPDSGSADFLAVDGGDPVVARQRIGYMPEHDCLPDAPAAAEFLTLRECSPARSRLSVSLNDVARRVLHLLDDRDRGERHRHDREHDRRLSISGDE